MPFTCKVFMRLLVLIPIFGMSILMIVTGYQEMKQNATFGLLSFIPAIFIFILSSLLLIHLLFLKKRKLAQLRYLFYTNRLVIYNHAKDQLLHELFYNEFPEFTFHENLNNFGYIIIGQHEPIITTGGIFKLKYGVNMKDHEIMLENLPEVKKEYLFLKELITKINSK